MATSLYLHVPFCVSRCRYCDFATSPTRHGDPLMTAYASSLARLVARVRDAGMLGGQRTAYVGGGTPSLLGAEALGGLLRACAAPGVAEVSFEANPESLTDDLLAAACEAGATRVSIGVQSLDDEELRALGRVHTSRLARERVGAAAASGLDVSVDLMCGIPLQTSRSWEASIAGALSLGVRHVSCYPLAIEPGTAMERLCESGRLPWPDEDAEADRMEAAERVLGAAGLRRYEVASYAAPGQACRHNIAYWTGREYLGLGTAASGMLGAEGYSRLRLLAPNLPALPAGCVRARMTCRSDAREIARAQDWSGIAWEVEFLTPAQAAAEDLMLAARTSAGIGAGLLGRACGALGPDRVRPTLDDLERAGLLERDGVAWVPTHAGWLLGNELYGALWGLAPDAKTVTLRSA